MIRVLISRSLSICNNYFHRSYELLKNFFDARLFLTISIVTGNLSEAEEWSDSPEKDSYHKNSYHFIVRILITTCDLNGQFDYKTIKLISNFVNYSSLF